MARSDFIPEPPKVPFWPFLTGFGLLVFLAGHLVVFTAGPDTLGIYLIATLALAVGSTLPAIPLTIQIVSRRSIRRAVSSQVSLDLIQAVEKTDQLMERMERFQRESNVQKQISDNLPQIVADKFEVVRKDVGEVLHHFETRFATLIDSRIEGVLKTLEKDLKGLHGTLEEGISRSQKEQKQEANPALDEQRRLLAAIQSLETRLRAMDRPGKTSRKEPASKPPSEPKPHATPESGPPEDPQQAPPLSESEGSFPEETSGPEKDEPEPSKDNKPAPSAPPSPRRKPTPDPDTDQDEQTSPAPKSTAAATSRLRPAHLIVSAFVGGAQQIYIRGDGPGMSKEHGIPLTMSGIGEWSWVSPLSEPFRFTLWLDNKTADRNGELIIEPGERKVVEPQFGEE